MIDNYDSFTYNLVQYLGELGARVQTVRNDAISVDEIAAMQPDALVVSPGPCTPAEAGISVAAIEAYGRRMPILGVCLGHQAIGHAFGARIVRAARVMHGKTDKVRHGGQGVFQGLPDAFEVVRYHSLAIERASLPACLEVTAWTDDGEIMGVRHRELDVEGVQFHPESIASAHGHDMLRRFLSRTRAGAKQAVA
ncbi:MAG: aminodeoxychorismate/anthranilate synthase component II [Burkholderiaceae bacterium]|nr:aminodeoxychorismate/anthranilate synthase component II [Burkholderiaceae bacterium]